MLTGIYSAATGMTAAEENQRVIAENLAYLDAPGYRSQTLGFESFEMQLQNLESQGVEGEYGALPQPVHRDFSVGNIKLTGRSLDVALDGDGFLTLQTDEGEVYTRNGVLQIDQDGLLQSTAGYPVLSEDGNTFSVPPGVPESELRVASDGQVFAGNNPLGKLKIVQFPDNQALLPVGVALFQPPEGVPPQAAVGVHVQQGYRELSNVSATTELVRMIVGVRYHQYAQQALTALSDAIESNISGQP